MLLKKVYIIGEELKQVHFDLPHVVGWIWAY